MPPLSISETYVDKKILLVTINSQTCKLQTITNFGYTTVFTHTITEEYCDGTLVVSVLDTHKGGTTFSQMIRQTTARQH